MMGTKLLKDSRNVKGELGGAVCVNRANTVLGGGEHNLLKGRKVLFYSTKK